MDQESAAEDSNLCGFDSDGSAVSAGNLPAENLRTRNSYRKAQRQVEASDLPTARKLPASKKDTQRPRAYTDPLARVPEDRVLEAQPSFEWDNFGEDISTSRPFDSSRKWSTNTQFEVPIDEPEQESLTESESSFGTGEEPDSDRQTSSEEDDMALDAAAWRRKAQKAIMEAEEDVLPFLGKRTTLDCLKKLCVLAASLRKELQTAQLELNEDPAYKADMEDKAKTCRANLTEFIVEAEATRAGLEAVHDQHREAAAASAAETAGMKRPVIARKVAAVGDELRSILKAFEALAMEPPATDEELFELVEKQKALESHHATTAVEAKEAARLALDNNMLPESGDLDDWLAAARKAKMATAGQVLAWRKDAGIWSGEKRRAVRTDLKMPTFVAGVSAKTTIYEFEKEWKEFTQAMDYSKEEAVKVLKQAIQQPTKADITNLQTVEDIFAYLKKHHGNPMMLLHAKEKEVRAWGSCKGSDIAQREWLVQAKSRLEGIVTLCKEHGIERYLHFSTVAGDIQSKFPAELTKEFKKILKSHLSPSGILEKEVIIGLLLEFIEDKILECTLGVNLDIVNYLGTTKDDGGGHDSQKQAGQHTRQKNWHQKPAGQGSHQPSRGRGGGNGGGGSSGFQVDDKCLNCGESHTHLFYCEFYITADLQTRFDQVRKQKACARCLGMRVKLVGRRDDWHPLHEKYCRTKFACNEGQCSTRTANQQFHITLCRHHYKDNKKLEYDFISSLDPGKLPAGCNPAGLQFLHMGTWLAQKTTATTKVQVHTGLQVIRDGKTYDVVPDVAETAVFMMQNLPASEGHQQLLTFYDSGCSGAGMSDRAYALLETTSVRPGPTVLDVAGGKRIEIPYGDEQFALPLDGDQRLAMVTALRMPQITSVFPLVKLQEAWDELAAEAASQQIGRLPTVDDTIGGKAVDLIIGIKYLKYYPEYVFSLPSGLAIYKAKFKSFSGHQAVLGGPHAAWEEAAAAVGHMNPRAYLTSEARAWCVQQSWVRMNQTKLSRLEEEDGSEVWCCQNEAETVCKMKTCKVDEREFHHVEDIGCDSPYRCEGCRNCQKCKRGEELEEISFREEAEQALIEASVELDSRNNKLTAALPFIEDPAISLKPNRFIAESVLKSQLSLFKRRPEMKDDTIRSHNKLLQRGYVKSEADLTPEERSALATIPGVGYFIPWRIVHNEGSLSTPCRMVFDASSKTPGGNSLNGILAKGKNRLVRLQSLLARFRMGKAAVTADISMAYNGTWLKPEYLKFQKYLWKHNLDEASPTMVMYVLTLIYGVRPSGGQCQVSIEKLADHFSQQGTHLEAAHVLKSNVYVDDVINSSSSVEECYNVALGIEEILAKGGMRVKAFSFSGQAPAEEVSADGVHVGLAGYMWQPLDDNILLEIGPPRLGKAKRGKSPEPVVGDFGQALKQCFTRRTVTGIVARVFDPLGLVTPITASLKLDLHDLCLRRLDWDDQIPEELLEVWVANMANIQDLRAVVFKRTVIPEDAADEKIDLLVAVDASQNLGVATIYGRVQRKCGLYSCQLIMARSKIVSNLTIPRAEMRSAVMGAVLSQVAKRNLGERLGEVTYVTDSTICLHWIHQDDRPLQVAVRNAVIEIRRFSEVAQWFHVESSNNIADLATRKAMVEDIGPESAWQSGYEWMRRPRAEMPLKTAKEVVLTSEEKRVAAAETRSKDIRGHSILLAIDKMATRYSHGDYILDPCRFGWGKVLRVMALVLRFISKLRNRVGTRFTRNREVRDQAEVANSVLECVSPDEIKNAERYFFQRATKEVLQFSKLKDYKECSVLEDGVLHFTGRILDGQDVLALETVMFDINPLSFCRPMVDRFSPVAYSIMIHTHWSEVNHLNAASTFRHSLSQAYIIGGRDLAQEVRNSCVFCKRFKAKLVQAEMGKIHDSRLTIAPPFTICQVDLLGPYKAYCEHNHRATVKVWGAIFKDPASGAVYVHAMSKCDTSAFIQAYTRFSARFCHPQKIYPDEGSQLLQACREMEVSWVNVAQTLNAQHGVGVEFQPCPVGGHNVHGAVERSIREVKKLFNAVYSGLKLDILGYETAFGWISNELNNLPFCVGSRYQNLDHLDLLTPNRLIHGRANKRALSGCCMVGAPSAMLARMEEVFQSWWRAWYDEKIADFVAKPSKWLRSDPPVQEGDIVVFLKTGEEQALGDPIWRIGRVVNVEVSTQDGMVRTVTIQYKNATENKFRETRRSVRKLAVLHREEELELVQQLNAAARAAQRLTDGQTKYSDQQAAVFLEVQRCKECVEPYLCKRHSWYFSKRPFLQEEYESSHFFENLHENDCSEPLCGVFRIHTDPWA